MMEPGLVSISLSYGRGRFAEVPQINFRSATAEPNSHEAREVKCYNGAVPRVNFAWPRPRQSRTSLANSFSLDHGLAKLTRGKRIEMPRWSRTSCEFRSTMAKPKSHKTREFNRQKGADRVVVDAI